METDNYQTQEEQQRYRSKLWSSTHTDPRNSVRVSTDKQTDIVRASGHLESNKSPNQQYFENRRLTQQIEAVSQVEQSWDFKKDLLGNTVGIGALAADPPPGLSRLSRLPSDKFVAKYEQESGSTSARMTALVDPNMNTARISQKIPLINRKKTQAVVSGYSHRICHESKPIDLNTPDELSEDADYQTEENFVNNLISGSSQIGSESQQSKTETQKTAHKIVSPAFIDIQSVPIPIASDASEINNTEVSVVYQVDQGVQSHDSVLSNPSTTTNQVRFKSIKNQIGASPVKRRPKNKKSISKTKQSFLRKSMNHYVRQSQQNSKRILEASPNTKSREQLKPKLHSKSQYFQSLGYYRNLENKSRQSDASLFNNLHQKSLKNRVYTTELSEGSRHSNQSRKSASIRGKFITSSTAKMTIQAAVEAVIMANEDPIDTTKMSPRLHTAIDFNKDPLDEKALIQASISVKSQLDKDVNDAYNPSTMQSNHSKRSSFKKSSLKKSSSYNSKRSKTLSKQTSERLSSKQITLLSSKHSEAIKSQRSGRSEQLNDSHRSARSSSRVESRHSSRRSVVKQDSRASSRRSAVRQDTQLGSLRQDSRASLPSAQRQDSKTSHISAKGKESRVGTLKSVNSKKSKLSSVPDTESRNSVSKSKAVSSMITTTRQTIEGARLEHGSQHEGTPRQESPDLDVVKATQEKGSVRDSQKTVELSPWEKGFIYVKKDKKVKEDLYKDVKSRYKSPSARHNSVWGHQADQIKLLRQMQQEQRHLFESKIVPVQERSKISHKPAENQFIIRKTNYNPDVCKNMVISKHKIENSISYVKKMVDRRTVQLTEMGQETERSRARFSQSPRKDDPRSRQNPMKVSQVSKSTSELVGVRGMRDSQTSSMRQIMVLNEEPNELLDTKRRLSSNISQEPERKMSQDRVVESRNGELLPEMSSKVLKTADFKVEKNQRHIVPPIPLEKPSGKTMYENMRGLLLEMNNTSSITQQSSKQSLKQQGKALGNQGNQGRRNIQSKTTNVTKRIQRDESGYTFIGEQTTGDKGSFDNLKNEYGPLVSFNNQEQKASLPEALAPFNIIKQRSQKVQEKIYGQSNRKMFLHNRLSTSPKAVQPLVSAAPTNQTTQASFAVSVPQPDLADSSFAPRDSANTFIAASKDTGWMVQVPTQNGETLNNSMALTSVGQKDWAAQDKFVQWLDQSSNLYGARRMSENQHRKRNLKMKSGNPHLRSSHSQAAKQINLISRGNSEKPMVRRRIVPIRPQISANRDAGYITPRSTKETLKQRQERLKAFAKGIDFCESMSPNQKILHSMYDKNSLEAATKAFLAKANEQRAFDFEDEKLPVISANNQKVLINLNRKLCLHTINPVKKKKTSRSPKQKKVMTQLQNSSKPVQKRSYFLKNNYVDSQNAKKLMKKYQDIRMHPFKKASPRDTMQSSNMPLAYSDVNHKSRSTGGTRHRMRSKHTSPVQPVGQTILTSDGCQINQDDRLVNISAKPFALSSQALAESQQVSLEPKFTISRPQMMVQQNERVDRQGHSYDAEQYYLEEDQLFYEDKGEESSDYKVDYINDASGKLSQLKDSHTPSETEKEIQDLIQKQSKVFPTTDVNSEDDRDVECSGDIESNMAVEQ